MQQQQNQRTTMRDVIVARFEWWKEQKRIGAPVDPELDRLMMLVKTQS